MSFISKSAFLLAVSTVVAASPLSAQEPAALGSWDITMETPMGEFSAVLTFSEDEEGYSVSIADAPGPGGAPAPESTFSNVIIDGGSFSFDRAMSTPQGAIELSYTGSIEGEVLTGEAKSDFGAAQIAGDA